MKKLGIRNAAALGRLTYASNICSRAKPHMLYAARNKRQHYTLLTGYFKGMSPFSKGETEKITSYTNGITLPGTPVLLSAEGLGTS